MQGILYLFKDNDLKDERQLHILDSQLTYPVQNIRHYYIREPVPLRYDHKQHKSRMPASCLLITKQERYINNIKKPHNKCSPLDNICMYCDQIENRNITDPFQKSKREERGGEGKRGGGRGREGGRGGEGRGERGGRGGEGRRGEREGDRKGRRGVRERRGR